MSPKGVKRGQYAKSAKAFPATVDTPTNAEEAKALGKAIQATQQKMSRWQTSYPDGYARAEAFLKLQEAARAAYRKRQSPEERCVEAVFAKAAYNKQVAAVQREVGKLARLGAAGFDLAVESNQGETDAAAAMEAETDPAAAAFEAEAAKIEAETEAAAAAIERGEF